MKLFVSHASDEKQLALAWKKLLKSTCAGAVEVWLSSDPDPEAGMLLGAEWREYLYSRLSQADAVLAILSPSSLARPWVTWECAAASGIEKNRRIIPIVYFMQILDLHTSGNPISTYHAYHGEDLLEVREVCERFARSSGVLPDSTYWDGPIAAYQEAINSYQRPGLVSASLLDHEEVRTYLRKLEGALRLVKKNSILRNFARNEVRRIANRLAALENGSFELRNGRPNKEITEYFCDYMAALDIEGSFYHTVSIRNFWEAITDGGIFWKYLERNVMSARAGAKIRRIFLIDKKAHGRASVRGDAMFEQVLQEHLRAINECSDNLQVKVHFSDNYARDLETFGNFGVWQRLEEKILMEPNYQGEALQKTDFYYHSSSEEEDNPLVRENKRLIDARLKEFETLWARGAMLDDSHFS